jgi:hypothetical protein
MAHDLNNPIYKNSNLSGLQKQQSFGAAADKSRKSGMMGALASSRGGGCRAAPVNL